MPVVDPDALFPGNSPRELERLSRRALLTELQLRNAFALLDAGRRGFLWKAEFREVYHSLMYARGVDNAEDHYQAALVDRRLADCTAAGPDKISYEEFCILMLQQTKS